jgi:hypothetical protein
MKSIFGTMVGFYILNFWVFPIFDQILFPWGGVRETHLHPIYMGMILLSGLIVACTCLILESIEELKSTNIDSKI